MQYRPAFYVDTAFYGLYRCHVDFVEILRVQMVKNRYVLFARSSLRFLFLQKLLTVL